MNTPASAEPTFRVVDGRGHWLLPVGQTPPPTETVVGDLNGLRLGADPAGSLALDGADGSLGGLVLPRGFAFDADQLLYLLDQPDQAAGAVVRRFDPAAVSGASWFPPLTDVGGPGDSAAPRRFNAPANLAIAGCGLYVADAGNRRVQVFSLASLALRAIWGPWAWAPRDVAAGPGAVLYVLGDSFIQRTLPGGEPRQWVVKEKSDATEWQRLAVDRDGRVYVRAVDPASKTSVLMVWTADGRADPEGVIRDEGQARDRFDPPSVRLASGATGPALFCLPPSLTRPCGRQAPDPPPTPELPLGSCRGGSPGAMLFDRFGNQVKLAPGEGPRPLVYLLRGTWIALAALDSKLFRCVWHRIKVELAELPSGSCVTVFAFATDDVLTYDDVLAHPELWRNLSTVVGDLQPRPPDPGTPVLTTDFLIDGDPGRYLWVRLDMGGDGFTSPVVSRFWVYYPRQSYLEYLPAVYSEDAAGRDFLQRFLSLFQTTWDALEQTIDEAEGLFDPRAVPDRFLSWLAGWIGLPLEGTWTAAQIGELLIAAPALFSTDEGAPRRGTPAGLVDLIRAYLAPLAGVTLGYEGDLPVLVEGFRERGRLLLNRRPGNEVDNAAPLWGPTVVPRAQLDGAARLDEAALISTGDPGLDVFNAHAHRFRVVVPSCWVVSAQAEAILRRVIDAEKPAHTAWQLDLIEPRLLLGSQSTLGIDTLLGDYPAARLGSPAADAPSRTPRGILGADTVLAAADVPPAFQLVPAQQLGIDVVMG